MGIVKVGQEKGDPKVRVISDSSSAVRFPVSVES